MRYQEISEDIQHWFFGTGYTISSMSETQMTSKPFPSIALYPDSEKAIKHGGKNVYSIEVKTTNRLISDNSSIDKQRFSRFLKTIPDITVKLGEQSIESFSSLIMKKFSNDFIGLLSFCFIRFFGDNDVSNFVRAFLSMGYNGVTMNGNLYIVNTSILRVKEKL